MLTTTHIMTPCAEVISELESNNSRLFKEERIHQEAEVGNDEFFLGCRMALDNLMTFGVKQVPMHSGTDGDGLSWVDFNQLAQALYRRHLTGHAARDAIQAAMTKSTQLQWDFWYRRILIKDLRCGVSDKTVNSVVEAMNLPDYAVPMFSCQLAHDGAKHEKKICGKKLIDNKLDGVRCLTVVNAENRTVTQYSRNGQLLENFSHITEALEKHIDFFERSWVLDGEMMSANFQMLMTQLKRKSNVEASDSVLHLFDIIPLSEFQQGCSTMGQRRRTALLKTFKSIFEQTGCIKIVTPEEVDLDTAVGQMQFEAINKNAIEQGYEGIMVKSIDGLYECKRSTSWLKIKPFLTVDLTIVSLEEGTGKNEGKLGALVCEGTDQEKFIRVNVGSGLTDDQRAEIWNDGDSVIGQVIEIKADCITQSQDTADTYSLRFPRFVRFRGFAVGEKI